MNKIKMNDQPKELKNDEKEITQSSFKLIDQDHPEIFWILIISPQSKERLYFEYNLHNNIKGWFSIVPKYLFKRQKVYYAPLYYSRAEAEIRKVDGNFAVVELVWENHD